MGGWFSGPEEVGGVWAEEEEEEEGRFRCLYLPGDGSRKEVWVAIGRRGKTAEFESRARPPPPRQSTMGPLTQLVKDGRVFAGEVRPSQKRKGREKVQIVTEKREKRRKVLEKKHINFLLILLSSVTRFSRLFFDCMQK